MTVREFIEACEDKDATMFSLFEEGLYLLGTISSLNFVKMTETIMQVIGFFLRNLIKVHTQVEKVIVSRLVIFFAIALNMDF